MGNITETSWFEEQLENMEQDFPFLNGDEPEGIPNGWDVDVDENGPFIVTDDVSTEIDLGRDVPDEIWEPEYLSNR